MNMEKNDSLKLVETIEAPEEQELTVQDVLEDQTVNFHPVLEVWREVLKPAAEEATKPPTPQWASRITSVHDSLRVQDMITFRDMYYGLIEEMVQILNEEIATDSDCLTYDNPEDDALENREHYKNLLLDWQMVLLRRELDWDCTSETAHIEVAALSEVHKLFFGQTGITSFLDNIKFEFTEADQQELADALTEMREDQ